MKAIILAAGEGKRLRPHTLGKPKCLVELCGIPLIKHQLKVLKKAGISDINIVTGYCVDKVVRLGYRTIYNKDYANTNMVVSLMCAEELLDGTDDVLIIYGDIVFESKVLKAVLGDEKPFCTAIDRSWLNLWRLRSEDPLSDAETLKLDAFQNIIELGKKTRSFDDIQGQYIGLIKVKADFSPKIVDIYQKMDRNVDYDGKSFCDMFMTTFLQHIIDMGYPLHAVLISGGWLEVDTNRDLELYNRMHNDNMLSGYYKLES